MAEARSFHTATLLQDGRVLLTGGGTVSVGEESSPPVATAELYDPAAGTFSAAGSMSTARALHSATLLQDGKVLVAGGGDGVGSVASAELYDPASGTFAATGSLVEGLGAHVAVLLDDGSVLIVGGIVPSEEGESDSTPTANVERYDPATGTFSQFATLAEPRAGHTATLLGDGTVLVTGGLDSSGQPLATAEILDPASATTSPVGPMTMGRGGHTASLLADGRVLLAGGQSMAGSTGEEVPDPAAGVEFYDPETREFTAAGS
jgi:hypothetical protein